MTLNETIAPVLVGEADPDEPVRPIFLASR